MKTKSLFFLGLGVVCLVAVGYFFSSQTDESRGSNNTQTTTSRLTETTHSTTQETTQSTEETDDSSRQITAETVELIGEFSTKWTTFTDVYERNQSVRDLLTDECIKKNAIDDNPNMAVVSVGTITSVAQDVDHPHQFVVQGTQESEGYENVFVLNITLNDDQKITEFALYDVRTGY